MISPAKGPSKPDLPGHSVTSLIGQPEHPASATADIVMHALSLAPIVLAG